MIYSKICQEMVDLPVQEQIQVLNMIGGAVSRGVNVSVIRRLCLARAAASIRGIKASNGKSISDCIDQCLNLLNTNQWEHAFLILTAMPDELEHTYDGAIESSSRSVAENLLRTKGALLKNVFYSFASRDDLLARSGGTLVQCLTSWRMYGFSFIEMYECSKMKRVMDKLLSILSSRTLMDSNLRLVLSSSAYVCAGMQDMVCSYGVDNSLNVFTHIARAVCVACREAFKGTWYSGCH